MNLSIQLKTIAAMCGLASCVFVSAGCVNLEKKFPDIRTYALDLTSQTHLTYEGEPASIRLSTFSAVPAFADRYLTYRTGETTYEQDFYNQMMVSPARMVQDQVFAWMKSSPLVSFILATDSMENPDYLIDGKILDLSGDYRRTDEAKAVLKIQFTVSRNDSRSTQVLFQKAYSAEVPIEQPSPKMLTEGWSLGMGQMMANFENDFKDLTAKSKAT